MLGWSIASRSKPDGTGDQSDHGARPKRGAPTIVDHQIGDEGWRETGASSDPGENPAIGDSALVDRNPAGEKLIRGRIDDRLACAEEEANCHEKEQGASNIRRNERGQSREDSPPDHSTGEHESWAETVSETSADRLKQHITEQHRAEDLAQLHVREMVCIDDRPARDGNVDAIQIGHCAEEKEQKTRNQRTRVVFAEGMGAISRA